MKNPANPLIYIIDQNAGYRKVLKACFNALKFSNLSTFDSCEECLQTGKIPDILILDHRMKEFHISGLDFLISKKQFYENTDFLFFSSDASVDIAVNTIKWGACDYFIKSKKGLEQLVLRINMLVRSYKTMRKKKLVYKAAVVSLWMFSLVFVIAIFLYHSA